MSNGPLTLAISGEQVLLASELSSNVKHVEIVEGHAVSVATKNEKTFTEDHTCVSIACWRPLALSLSQRLIVVVLGQPLSFSLQSFLLYHLIGLLETGIGILYQIGAPHRDRSWRLQVNDTIINRSGDAGLDLGLWLSLAFLATHVHSSLTDPSCSQGHRPLGFDFPR